MEPSSRVGEELLSADDVARYLELEPVTIYRWCRDGRLPCLKLGKVWRIRRSALDAFLRQAERPRTLAAHLGAFLEVPDQVLAVAEDAELLTRLDAAFLQAGETRGGRLVKLYEPKQTSRRALATAYQQHGLDTASLESSGRLQWCPLAAPEEAVPVLRQVLASRRGTSERSGSPSTGRRPSRWRRPCSNRRRWRIWSRRIRWWWPQGWSSRQRRRGRRRWSSGSCWGRCGE